MLDMLFRVSTFKKSTVKMLVKMPGLKSWIFSGKKFEDSLIFRIRREGGARVGGRGRCMSQFCHTYLQKKEISEEN
jgi:hypothetical protein